MQSQLLKRFESSWYAALQTVNRMRDGNDVMLRVMAERGVVPPPEVIKDLVGEAGEDDAFLSAELIDEALAGAEGGLAADRFNDRFMPDLQKDRDTLATMAATTGRPEGQSRSQAGVAPRGDGRNAVAKGRRLYGLSGHGCISESAYRAATGTAGRTLVDDGHGFGEPTRTPAPGSLRGFARRQCATSRTFSQRAAKWT